MNKVSRQRLLRFVTAGVGIALFGWLVWQAGPESWARIRQSDWRYVLGALLFSGSAQMISSWRLKLVAEGMTGRSAQPWRRYYQIVMVSQALGLIVPRGVSTIGGKSVGLRALGIPLRQGVGITLIDNLFDVALLTLLALPGFLYLLGRLEPLSLLVAYAVLMIVSTLALVLFSKWSVQRGESSDRLVTLTRLAGRVPRVGPTLVNLSDDIRRLAAAPRRLLMIITLTQLQVVVLTTRFFLIGAAINMGVQWLLFAALFPATQLSLVLAFAPGGLGVFDVSWYGLMRLSGLSDPVTLAYIVAQRAMITAFILVWTGISTLLSWTVRADKRPAWG